MTGEGPHCSARCSRRFLSSAGDALSLVALMVHVAGALVTLAAGIRLRRALRE